MGRWGDIAQWRGPSPNTSGQVTAYRYVVVHIASGTYEGTIAWQLNPDSDVSSHFVVARDGRCAQMLDTGQRSWTQKAGNPYSISIECEGFTPGDQGYRAGWERLTDAQVAVCGAILARAHREHGIPLQLTGAVGTPGLGHHSMGAESGVDWGHSACPGTVIKGQKPAILARAVEIVNGGDEMGLDYGTLGEPTRLPEWREHAGIYAGDVFAEHLDGYGAWGDVKEHDPKGDLGRFFPRRLAELEAKLDEVHAATAHPTPVVIAQEQMDQLRAELLEELGDVVESRLRAVLGGLDGATPPAG